MDKISSWLLNLEGCILDRLLGAEQSRSAMTSTWRIRMVAASFAMKLSHAYARMNGKGFKAPLPEDAKHR
jgi:hypothetical protein